MMRKPVVAVTFGDASGIGPELVARLLARPESAAANIVLVGDAWVWAQGQRIAGTDTRVKTIQDWRQARDGDGTPMLLDINTVAQNDIVPAQVTTAAGKGARAALTACLDAAQRGDIDAVCFAPLNKQAMKKGGMAFEDELHFFADYLEASRIISASSTRSAPYGPRASPATFPSPTFPNTLRGSALWRRHG